MKRLDDRREKLATVAVLLIIVTFTVYGEAKKTLQSLEYPSQPAQASQIASSPSGNNPVIVAAGDIACEPGKRPTPTACQHVATAQLIEQIKPAAVLTIGDNQYPHAQLEHFLSAGGFNGSWGRFKSIIHPTPGNHEYEMPGAKGYFDYFGSQAGDSTKGYYSFDVGSWHLIALNSEIDVSETSPQRQWLKQDLKQHQDAFCTLAYWHKPRFSSGYHADDATFDGLWRDLYAYDADVVLSGHSHNYERFEAQNPDRKLDGLRGIVEFTVGTGGRNFQPLTGRKPHSVVIQNTNFGVLKMTLHPRSYSFSFESIPGSQSFSDSGELPCH
jgi:hypothetical protein